MLNFAVGPVQMDEDVRAVGGEQVPYFRTPEFSAIMKENEAYVKKFAGAADSSRAVFLTGSGSAAMEAAVINLFTPRDKLLVINGGSFGQRFSDLCGIYELDHTEIKLPFGEPLTKELLIPYENKGYTGLLVNVHETSTGVLYDIEMIASFCSRNGIFLVADAISSFLADPLHMKALKIGAMIISSQKTLACPPGVSIIVLDEEAVLRVGKSRAKTMYLDLKRALTDGERGQTPFTPAVGILRQLHRRLQGIDSQGGPAVEIAKCNALAMDFRHKITGLPLELSSSSLSNAVTPLHPYNVSAYAVYTTLKNDYGIWVCPNGGELADKIFRVGHIGALSKEDNSTLVEALSDMARRGQL